MILKSKKSYKKKQSFSTIELIITTSIILVLGGIFLLNYRLQKDNIELSNTVTKVAQEIRKAQDLTIGQAGLPEGCIPYGAEYPYPGGFGMAFETNVSHVSLFVDKNYDDEGSFYAADGCVCGEITDECVENLFIPSSIKVSDLIINGTSHMEDSEIFFRIEDLASLINTPADYQTLEIVFCAKADCENATKSIEVNNKGMVWIK